MAGFTTKNVPSQAIGGGVTFPSIDKGAAPGMSAQLTTAAGSTNAGNLKLQGSNDNLNFQDIPSATSVVSSGAGAFITPLSENYMRYIRAVYVQTSGAGNATLTYHWPKGA